MIIENDAVIIGAGPAGMSAAIYLKRANINFKILEKGMPGGKLALATEIDNYPGISKVDGFTLIMNFQNQLTELGIQIETDEVLKIEKIGEFYKVFTQNNEILTKTIIIATGMNPIKVSIKNQDKFLGKGVSYCAVCDGFFFKNKDVLLYGNNQRAYLEALYLNDLVNKIYFVHDENCEQCLELEKLRKSNKVEEYIDYKISEINGEETVKEAKIINLKTNDELVLKVDGVFPLFNETPSNYLFNGLDLKTDKNFIVVDEKMETSVSGIFAAGDCVKNQLKQVVTATRDGALAATNAISYIRGKRK